MSVENPGPDIEGKPASQTAVAEAEISPPNAAPEAAAEKVEDSLDMTQQELSLWAADIKTRVDEDGGYAFANSIRSDGGIEIFPGVKFSKEHVDELFADVISKLPSDLHPEIVKTNGAVILTVSKKSPVVVEATEPQTPESAPEPRAVEQVQSNVVPIDTKERKGSPEKQEYSFVVGDLVRDGEAIGEAVKPSHEVTAVSDDGKTLTVKFKGVEQTWPAKRAILKKKSRGETPISPVAEPVVSDSAALETQTQPPEAIQDQPEVTPIAPAAAESIPSPEAEVVPQPPAASIPPAENQDLPANERRDFTSEGKSRFQRLGERLGIRTAEKYSTVKAETLDQLMIWNEQRLFNKVNNQAQDVAAKRDQAASQRKELEIQRATLQESIDTALNTLGLAQHAQDNMGQAERELAEYTKKIESLQKKENTFNTRLDILNNEKASYETERNRIAQEVIQKMEFFVRPHAENVERAQATRDRLAGEIAAFNADCAEYNAELTSLRDRRDHSRSSFERKTFGGKIKEIESVLKESNKQLSMRRKQLVQMNSELAEVKKPRDKFNALRDQFAAVTQRKGTYIPANERIATAVNTSVPRVDTVSNPSVNGSIDTSSDGSSSASQPAQAESGPRLDVKTLKPQEFAVAWNKKYGSRGLIEKEPFAKFIKDRKIDLNKPMTAQGFINLVIRPYLSQNGTKNNLSDKSLQRAFEAFENSQRS